MTITSDQAPIVRRAQDAAALIDSTDLPPTQHYINGSFQQSPASEMIAVVDPSTEEIIAQTPDGTVEDVDQAVEAAVAARVQWARLVPKARSEVLHQVADRLAENADLLVRLESANTGKPLAVSREDVDGTIDTFRFMAGALRATTTMAAGDYAENHLSLILREPLGVIGVITPWNYPLLMAAWKIAPILAAGNTLVIKPSELTPLTTLKFAELMADLLPPGVMNVVTGRGAVAGARLSGHPDVNMIALTGSVNSGRAVARSAADTLKRVHLELGGQGAGRHIRGCRPQGDCGRAAGSQLLELRPRVWRGLPRPGARIGGRRTHRPPPQRGGGSRRRRTGGG